MDKKELEERTKKFALEVIRFVADLPEIRNSQSAFRNYLPMLGAFELRALSLTHLLP